MVMNQNNISFYNLSDKNFITDRLAYNAGLDKNIDIDVILDLIQDDTKSSLIDFGAGEGRVISHLLKKRYSGKISGVEYADSKIDILREKFASLANVTIFRKNAMSLQKQHDYALLSFSFLLEFGKREQRKLISHLNSIISKKIFIDLPVYRAKKNGFYLPNNYVCLKEAWGQTRGYFPTALDIENYTMKTDFYLHSVKTYTTSNNRKRNLYSLFKIASRI